MRRIATYIHENLSWPQFTWDQEQINQVLPDIRHRQGRLLGKMAGLGFSLQSEASLRVITLDVIKSSEIEGELLPSDQVRSSVARRLGLDIGAVAVSDRRVEGVVELMLDATQHYDDSLTEKRLFAWHAALFPTGRSEVLPLTVGYWRKHSGDPMQVVSGPMGKEKVHYEAPDASVVKAEMKRFMQWFNEANQTDLLVKAGIAHLWFITIHPFDDGNGRIARALTDLLLARSDQSNFRFYSLSNEIQADKKQYYHILETTQKGNLDITAWLLWFLDRVSKAVTSAEVLLNNVLFKAQFWQRHATTTFNIRQHFMLNKLLDGLDGKLNTTKWAKMTKTSQDTALRDIQQLINLGILCKESEGGRSTNYRLAGEPNV